MPINQYTREIIRPRQVANMVEENAIEQAGSVARGLGGAFQQAQQVFNEIKVANQKTELNDKIISYQSDLMDLQDSVRSETMANPDSFDDVFSERLNDLNASYEGGITDEEVKGAFFQTAREMDLNLKRQNMSWKNQRKISLSGERLEDAQKKLGAMALRGADIDELLKNAEASGQAANGVLAPEKVSEYVDATKANIVNNRLQMLLNNGETQEAKKLLDGGRFDNILGGDGLGRGYSAINQKEKQIDAEFEKRKKEEKAVDESRIDLTINAALSPDDLGEVATKIDELEPKYGESWANKYRSKIVASNRQYQEKMENIALGATFATGDNTINPSDKKHKKAFDSYYSAITQSPVYVNAEPQEKNKIVTDILSKANYVPDTLKGELKQASLSYDEETISQAADLIDQISINSPQLLPQLGSEASLNRLNMINDRINAGVKTSDAIKAVDEKLDPRNAPQQETIKEEINKYIKDNNIDFKQKVVDSFETTGDWFASMAGGGIDETSIAARNSIDSASIDYRIHWEDAYSQTRDVAQADKKASQAMGLWSRTDVNPSPMPMKYAPEMYYSIPNVPSDWIRKQAVEDVLEFTKGGFTEFSKKELERNLYIVNHPDRTQRTATQGAPEYSIMIMRDGVPLNILGEGEYWKPDTDKVKKELIEGSFEKSSEKEKFGSLFRGLD